MNNTVAPPTVLSNPAQGAFGQKAAPTLTAQGLVGAFYHIATFGCQMNKSDSERVAGLLDAFGGVPAIDMASANIIVFMTCCVREAADERLYGQVASLKNAGALIAVGGCIGQRDAQMLVEQMPHVRVVFGTHNLNRLPALLAATLESGEPVVEVLNESQPHGAHSTLPSKHVAPRREHAWHAWLPIMTGCNNFCSYCVVPLVRGHEQSEPFDELVREAESFVAQGVREITLLGQNVNSYGRDRYGEPRFAQLLHAIAATGIERLRFATSHPKDLLPQTIEAFAQLPAVMPALHLPVQSGSNRILKAMNRHYSAEHYLELIASVRAACERSGKGRVAFSTDIIVGFPGENEEDFEATLALAQAVGYTQAFTFIYSQREGTPAASLALDTPHELVQERFERLVALVQQSAWECNQGELGRTLPVLFEGASKRDKAVLAGRAPGNQTVHVPLPAGSAVQEFAGDILPVRITEARTWYLNGELAAATGRP